jgi:beta-lactamase regulating signal transducer with metallopeptidase domain/HEAT repeat protein
MTIVESVGWVLLHFVWQGLAIALSLAAVLALTSHAQARLRYALSCGALALMLLATLATAAGLLTENASPAQPTLSMRAPELAPSEQARPDDGAGGSVEAAPSAAGTSRASNASALRTSLLPPLPVGAAMPWLVSGWVIGVLLLSVRLLGGWCRTRALRLDGVSAVPDWCQARLESLSVRMRVTRDVAIVSSVRTAVPVVLGHLRPVILLPAAALASLSPGQLEAILAHELAHVRRHDYLVNLAQTVIETLLFYHPAVWWVSRQVRMAREHCCDDVAVAVCRSRQDYVHALLGLEELRSSPALLALGATDGSLLARGRRLLAPSQGHASSARLAAGVIALTVVAATVAGASFDSPAVARPPAREALTANASGEREDSAVAWTRGTGQTQATPVVTAPGADGTLASRFDWAERAARDARHARYWIGYGIAPVNTLPGVVYIDRAAMILGNGVTLRGDILSSDARGLHFPGRPLSVPGAGRGIKLLLEFERTRGEPTLRAVHASTFSIPVETKELPVFWLGDADPAQSLDRLDRLYRTISPAELKHDVIATIGVHDASAAVVAWLEGRIASRDPDELRGDAAEWIAWHPIAASITALDRTARSDRSSPVRQEAAEALGDLAMPEATPVLIELAKTLSDPDARREAVEALGERPELAARDALASIAKQDASLDIQREAVETLGDFEDQRGVSQLIDLARSHANIEIRREAVETLGDAMPKDTAVPLLEQIAIKDPDPTVQEEAIDTIADIDDTRSLETLIQLARSHASVSVRREAVEALAHRASGQHEDSAKDRTAVVELLTALAKSDRDGDVQVEAVETLGEIHDSSSVAQLRELARTHADERVRVEAVESLGESGVSAAETAAFLKDLALADASGEVRAEVFETLAELPDGAGISALVDLAREHPVPDARKDALDQLLESDHPAARAIFERALQKNPGR